MESIDRLREYVHDNCALENERAILRMADAIEREVGELRDREYGNGREDAADAAKFADRLKAAVDGREDVTLFCVDYMPALEGSDAAKMDELTRAAMNGEDVDLWGRAYTALPVDAEGEPIHVGDVLDPPADCDDYASLQVVRLMYDGYEQEWFFDGEAGGFCGMVGEHMDVAGWTHHHAPTVEDVLREFLGEMQAEESDPHRTIAEFAAKLRLAGDE